MDVARIESVGHLVLGIGMCSFMVFATGSCLLRGRLPGRLTMRRYFHIFYFVWFVVIAWHTVFFFLQAPHRHQRPTVTASPLPSQRPTTSP